MAEAGGKRQKAGGRWRKREAKGEKREVGGQKNRPRIVSRSVLILFRPCESALRLSLLRNGVKPLLRISR